LLLLSCGPGPQPVAVPPGARPVEPRLDHLRHLGLDVTVAGRPARAVALYAEAPEYRPIGTPERDGSEGVAAVDDAARAAVVYLRHFEQTADPSSRREAVGLLRFVTAMEQGDGDFLNFVDADGTPNRAAPTSRKAFSYWAAGLHERASEPMLAALRLPDGGIYAVPWKTNPMMLMYNVDPLAAAGVTPLRTHPELLDALRRLIQDTEGDGRPDRWGLWAPLNTTWFERFYDFYPLYLAASGGRTLVSRGEVAFENEAAVGPIDVLAPGIRRASPAPVQFRGTRPVHGRDRGHEDRGSLVREGTGAAQGPGASLRRDARARAGRRRPGGHLRVRRSQEHRGVLDDAASRGSRSVRGLLDVAPSGPVADRGGRPAPVSTRLVVGRAVRGRAHPLAHAPGLGHVGDVVFP
jgi:hypothetical protein